MVEAHTVQAGEAESGTRVNEGLGEAHDVEVHTTKLMANLLWVPVWSPRQNPEQIPLSPMEVVASSHQRQTPVWMIETDWS